MCDLRGVPDLQLTQIEMKIFPMRESRFNIIVILSMMLFFNQKMFAQKDVQLVRLAKLVIEANQLDTYKVFLKEEIEISVKVEPGVKTLYAVSDNDHPNHITILEIYADTSAYKAHLKTPHFIKYKTGTKDMVKSLELIQATPLIPDMKIK